MNIKPTINYDDFQKLDIRIGTVISAEKIPDTDKLIKLEFDFGEETRQIVSGIAETFSDPSVLVGKQMPVLVNLEPRKLRGVESQGMILALEDAGEIVLLTPEKKVESGVEVG